MKGSDVQNLPEGFGDVFPFQERTFLAKSSVKVYSVVQSNLVIRNVLIRNKLALRNLLWITNPFIP